MLLTEHYHTEKRIFNWMDKNPRKTLGIAAGYGVFAVVLVSAYDAVTSQKPPVAAGSEDSSSILKTPVIYSDANANEVAKAHNIDTGSFLKFNEQTLNSLTAFLGNELYPIYPPAVLDYRDLIYNLSDEFNIPPNVIATIMTIESAGNKEAGSSASAIGLFQPLEDKFPPEQRKLVLMRDPLTNGRAGMKYFVDACLPVARKMLVSIYGDSHVNVYARALMAYNGGPGTVELPFSNPDLYDETKFYGDHFVRFAMTAEIAAGLRKVGYSDEAITKALTLDSSLEIDARASALQQFHLGEIEKKEYYSYEEYEQVIKELSYPTPGVNPQGERPTTLGAKVLRSYLKYKNSPDERYKYPLSPGMRIWNAVGGTNLLLSVPLNQDKEAYFKVNTKRR